jgi:hypothetical protein
MSDDLNYCGCGEFEFGTTDFEALNGVTRKRRC